MLAMVHGDDFVSVGSRVATSKFRKQLEARFEIKPQVIGPGSVTQHARVCSHESQDSRSRQVETQEQPARRCLLSVEEKEEIKEGRVLNLITRWTEDGWEIEPDQRHADIIVHELGLSDSKPVSTPGETESRQEEGEDQELLDSNLATKYRALAARANYLAGDRTDIMYSVKEMCRSMASPTVGAWKS